MTTHPTFEIDKAGLAKILARRGIEFAVLELIQNAFDEEGVAEVDVHLEDVRRGFYRLRVSDNSAEGFADLRHAYTLFAESRKKANPEQRGRFNLGEKLVVAVARTLTITTTKGTVRFDSEGRHHDRTKTDRGTMVDLTLRMSHEEADRTRAAVRSVIVPPAIRLMLDGERVRSVEPIETIAATLPTEIADDEGYLRGTERKTSIRVFEVQPGGVPTLYELGIPVVAFDCAWNVDIGQKVPLNTDRDNVTPAYARRVRAEVLNAMHARLPSDHAATAWVEDVMESSLVSSEAVEAVITQRYGDKRVIRDPSDPEGTKLAVSQGYTVIEPGSFSKAAWGNIRSSGAALPAGQVTPSPKPYSPNGEPLDVIDRADWTPGMQRFEKLAEDIVVRAGVLPAGRLGVEFTSKISWPYAATYGRGGGLVVNIGRLGHQFLDARGRDADIARIRLLIHEFGHEYSSDHLSSEYHDALCRIGAKLFLGAAL